MRGLLLDLDGVLCDSLPPLREAYRRFLEPFGVPGTDAEFETLNGPPLAEVVRRLKAVHGLPGGEDALLEQYNRLVRQAHRAASAAAGCSQVLADARALGWRTAVVTSAPQASVSAWLERQGPAHLFDLIVHGEAVSRGKPDPEPYVVAAAGLGCAAQLCLAVEDSEQGAAAALGAGAQTLFLGARVPPVVASHPRFAGRLERFADVRAYLETDPG